MKDDALERVLTGLGKVEAPSGLEGRVLRRMADPASRRASGLGLRLRPAGGLALAGVLAWYVGVLGLRGKGHTSGAKAPLQLGAERPKAEALGYLLARNKAGAGGPERGKAGEAERMAAVAGGVPQRLKPRFSEGAGGAAEAVPLSKTGFSAASKTLGNLEARAAVLESFPAPPEPLTEQERLLVRVARHPQRSNAQFLIAEVREAELARGDAEFARFFPAPEAEVLIEVSQPVQAKENQDELPPKDR